ncbi:MAG: hypothetical protein B7Z66_12440 [Chromatiales bacterium 21-64-14]|nr:MAG: hypothetical protein B7Z66_12440 [Chromatiales bacterium 21-64-14]HQU16959.1 patatin-like phospholipase RssA [Gammaproteobacteria bacterium]
MPRGKEHQHNARAAPRVGVALGSGSARGWAHIGVLRALEDAGIVPDVVCGTSIGALTGAACALGRLEPLDHWVRSLTWRDVVRFLDVRLSGGGLIHGERLMRFFRGRAYDVPIESLPKVFAAVATDLGTGREIWLDQGSLAEAVRASFAVPGLFAPVLRDQRWLVDGGLVNPVPVSVCRAFGADIVIAVNLNGDLVGRNTRRHAAPPARKPEPDPASDTDLLSQLTARLTGTLRARAGALIAQVRGTPALNPGIFEVLSGSLNIMQDRITRSRMAGDPPDLVVAPRLAHIGLMEFERGAEAIAAGRQAVEQMLPAIKERLKNPLQPPEGI